MTRKMVAATALAFTVVLVAWYLLAWSPATKRLHESQAVQASAQSSAASLVAQEQALLAKGRLLPAEQAKAAYVLGELPLTVDVPGFIDQLTAIASATHVSLEDVAQNVTAPTAASAATGAATTGGSALPADIGVLSLQFSVAGSYAQTMNFIKAVQRLPRFVAVGSLAISEAQSTLTTALVASAYFDSQPFPKVP